MRKLINGGDPALAQELTDSGFLWVSDLTDPDPFYGFPIISGMLLYLNVEMAIGQKSLSGEASSKSNLARILKDVFQSMCNNCSLQPFNLEYAINYLIILLFVVCEYYEYQV